MDTFLGQLIYWYLQMINNKRFSERGAYEDHPNQGLLTQVSVRAKQVSNV